MKRGVETNETEAASVGNATTRPPMMYKTVKTSKPGSSPWLGVMSPYPTVETVGCNTREREGERERVQRPWEREGR